MSLITPEMGSVAVSAGMLLAPCLGGVLPLVAGLARKPGAGPLGVRRYSTQLTADQKRCSK